MKNYYQILGVSENASSSEIQTAYEVLTAKYHPENFVGEAKKMVEERLEEIKESYSVLSDDFLRNQYDKEIGIQSSIDIENIRPKNKEEKKSTREEKKKKEKKEKPKIGTAKNLAELTQRVFSNLPKIKPEKPNKKAVLSLIAAIIIVVLIGVILWFIPFTNGFMRSFLLIG